MLFQLTQVFFIDRRRTDISPYFIKIILLKRFFEEDMCLGKLAGKVAVVRVTLTMNRAILLSRTTMTATCDRIPALFRPRILGFGSMQKSTLAGELVLSEAERSLLSS